MDSRNRSTPIRATIEALLARQTSSAFISTTDLARKVRAAHSGYLPDHNQLGTMIAEAALRRRHRVICFGTPEEIASGSLARWG